jgi:hypothetical protein
VAAHVAADPAKWGTTRVGLASSIKAFRRPSALARSGTLKPVRIRSFLALTMVGIGIFASPTVSSANSMATTKRPSSLLEKVTPAPGGGWVKKVMISGIPGSQAYLGWFEGSADSDIVFDRGGVVVDPERSTLSKAVAADFTRFAQRMYRELKIDTPSLT